MPSLEAEAKLAHEIAIRAGHELSGHSPNVQGAALAQMLAAWIAGHVHADDELIEALLAAHIDAVRALIPIMFKERIEPQLKRMRQ